MRNFCSYLGPMKALQIRRLSVLINSRRWKKLAQGWRSSLTFETCPVQSSAANTDHPHWNFRWFSALPQGKCRQGRQRTLLLHPLQFVTRSTIPPYTVQAKSHATHTWIFIDGCNWTNSTGFMGKVYITMTTPVQNQRRSRDFVTGSRLSPFNTRSANVLLS